MEAKEHFHRIASRVSAAVGTAKAFILAIAVIVTWGVSGPIFHFSDTWQLVINTGTTIVTFLMVFLIQNTQNRDAKAIHLKLDELIRAIRGARNELIDLEEMTDAELEALAVDFRRIHAKKHSPRSRSRTSASAVDEALSTDTAKADRQSSSPDHPRSSRPTSAE